MMNLPPVKDLPFDIEPGPLQAATPAVKQFYSYWLRLALAAGGLPRRNDIDPTEITPCLPYCMIYARQGDEQGFECLLSGESINAAWGRNLKGARTVDMFEPRDLKLLHARWDFLLEKGKVAHCDYDGQGHYKSVERIVTPLLDANGEANIIMGLAIYRYDSLRDQNKAIHPPGVGYKYYDPLGTA